MTAIILGTTMAQAGTRTLIVDTDLRRPRLHKTFGVSAEEGLTSVLLGTCKITDAIKKTEVVDLDGKRVDKVLVQRAPEAEAAQAE